MVCIIVVVGVQPVLVVEVEMQGEVVVRGRSLRPRLPERRPVPRLYLTKTLASSKKVGAEVDGAHRRTSVAEIGQPLLGDERLCFGGLVSQEEQCGMSQHVDLLRVSFTVDRGFPGNVSLFPLRGCEPSATVDVGPSRTLLTKGTQCLSPHFARSAGRALHVGVPFPRTRSGSRPASWPRQSPSGVGDREDRW